MAYRIRWTPLALAGALGLAGCEDAMRPGQPSAHLVHHPDQVQKRIGRRGGVITSRDGRLTLTIPPGALSRSVRITIAPVAPEHLGHEWAGIEVERAYDLGPDGLTFAVPVQVAVRSDQQPVQTGGSLSVQAEFLLTAVDGNIESLDSVRVQTDGQVTLVTGRLNHFSPLIETADFISLELGELTFSLRGVPPEAEVGRPFGVVARVLVSRGVSGGDASFQSGDLSRPPVVFLGPKVGVLEPVSPTLFEATLPYSCQDVGEGDVHVVLVYVPPSLAASKRLGALSVGALLTRDVNCVERPPHSLTVLVTGEGIVTSSPPGIDCPNNPDDPDDCEEVYPFAALVGLTATPSPGWRFVRWVGEDCQDADDNPLTVLVQMTKDVFCEAVFTNIPDQVPTGAGLVFEGRYDLNFVADAAALSMAGNSVFIAAHEGGTDAIEVSLIDPANLTLVGEGALCDGTTAIIHANDPAIGPVVYGYSATSPWSCITQAPLGGLVQLFNLATAIGDAQPLPGDPSTWLISLHGLSAVRRQTAAGTFTDVVLTPTERSCPGPIAFNSSYAYVVKKEGLAGTSTEPCNANRGLARIRLSDNTLTGSVSFGTAPRTPAVSADGSTLYVPDFAEQVVHEVNTSTMAVTGAIPVPGGPVAAALSPDGTHLIVARWFLDDLALVDLGTDLIASTEPSRGRHPVKIIARPNGEYLILNYGEFPIVGGVLATFRYTQVGQQ